MGGRGKNLLVIGSGGREHTLAGKLKIDQPVKKVFCSPGNGGTASSDRIHNLDYDSWNDLHNKIIEKNIEFVVVGSEKPLSKGLADFLREKNIPVFGFGKKAAKLESSKVFAAKFKEKYNVSSPNSKVFTSMDKAEEYLNDEFKKGSNKEFWVKADELCGGKGAIHAPNFEEGKEALKTLFKDKKCGEGKKVVIQKHINGEEATILTFTDGETFVPMPPMQDHKPIYNDGKGPNTGGMGAYAPAPVVDEEVWEKFEKNILKPTKKGIKQEGIRSPGILYFGLIIDENKDPYVLEYNVRFGDPEAQPVLPLLDSDLLPILRKSVEGKLDEIENRIKWKDKASVCVVLSTEGYPTDYGNESYKINSIEEAEKMKDVKIFHAGTEIKDDEFYTDGGRILGVRGIGKTIKGAQKRAYSAVNKINFKGMHCRTDIAEKAL